MVTYNDAKLAYGRFIKESKGLFNFSKTEKLTSFAQIQKENGAYSSTDIGIRDVPIEKIKGSVQKYMDFDINFVPKNRVIEDRWCRVYMGFLAGASLPPLILYKIKEDYFVYDGNHRVSVAKFLNFATIEAEVKEFIPSTDTKENAIYREKFLFEKQTGLQSIELTETGQYERLLKEIEDYQKELNEKEGKDLDFIEISELWYMNIYQPSIKIMEENKILDERKNRTLADYFVYFLDHKYFESEKKGKDVGFGYALINFINIKTNLKKEDVLKNKINLSESVESNLKKLQTVDKRKTLDNDILWKIDKLKEITGLSFDNDILLVYDIEDYLKNKDIDNFEEGLNIWYRDCFKKRMEGFSERVQKLPEQYSSKLDIVMKNREKLFYSIQSYINEYKSEIECENCFETVANYIIDIYISIVDILIKKDISDETFDEVYFALQGRYSYLGRYKENVTMEEAANVYFASTNKFKKNNTWLFTRHRNEDEYLIDYMIKKFSEKLKDKDLFEYVIQEFGRPKQYGTIITFEEAKKMFYQEMKEGKWVKDKLLKDIEKLIKQEEIMAFFKTISVIESLADGNKEINILDFYADIIDYGTYLSKDIAYIDIIDLALEYKNRHN